MTAVRVGAVATDAELGMTGERRQQGDQPGRARGAHLASILPREACPAGVRERLALDPRQQRGAGREVGYPDVVEVPRGDLVLAHPSWRSTDRPKAEAFACAAWRAEADDAN